MAVDASIGKQTAGWVEAGGRDGGATGMRQVGAVDGYGVSRRRFAAQLSLG